MDVHNNSNVGDGEEGPEASCPAYKTFSDRNTVSDSQDIAGGRADIPPARRVPRTQNKRACSSSPATKKSNKKQVAEALPRPNLLPVTLQVAPAPTSKTIQSPVGSFSSMQCTGTRSTSGCGTLIPPPAKQVMEYFLILWLLTHQYDSANKLRRCKGGIDVYFPVEYIV
jgi:hypothetical protein